MADVNVSLNTGGTVKQGAFTPEVGGTVEIALKNNLTGSIGVDYTEPDSLKLNVAGDFTVKAGRGTIDLGAGISENLFNGDTNISGSMEFNFNKNVSVKAVASTDSHDGTQLGTVLTLKF